MKVFTPLPLLPLLLVNLATSSTPAPNSATNTYTSSFPTASDTPTPSFPTASDTPTSGFPTASDTPPPGFHAGSDTPTSGFPTASDTPTSGFPTASDTPTSGFPTASDTPTPGFPTASDTPTSGFPTASDTPTSGFPTASDTPTSGFPTASDTPTSGFPTASDTPTPGFPTASITSPVFAPTTVAASSFPAVASSSNDISSPSTTLTAASSVGATAVSVVLSTNQMSSTTQGASSGSAASGHPQEPTSTTIPSLPVSSNTNAGIIGPSNRCQGNPCGVEASCVNLYENFICLCVEGYYYSSMRCLRGKTFLGKIAVRVIDTSDLQNEGSPAYWTLWSGVNKFIVVSKGIRVEGVWMAIPEVQVSSLGFPNSSQFQEAFENTDYKQTVMHMVSVSPLQARSVSVSVRVVNIFEQNTTENEMSVSTKINDAKQNSAIIISYSQQDQCDYYGCEDIDQDNCSSSINCQCKEGLQRPFPQSPFCLALQCSEDCKAESNKQCLKKSTGELECACLPGYKSTTSGACQECPFGYSGMDCKDQFQLILTIVGTILGVLVLSLGIALVISMRPKHRKNIEEQNLIENDFQNLQLQQTGFSNLGANGSLFPEVKTAAPRDLHTQNPYVNH